MNSIDVEAILRMPRKHGRSSSRSTTASMNGVRKRTRDDSTLEDEVGSTHEPSPLKAARTTCFQSPTSQRQGSAGPTIRKASPPTPARLPPLQSIIAELDGDDDEDEIEFVGEKICIQRCFDPNDGISVASGKAWAGGQSRRKQSTQHRDSRDQYVRSAGRAPAASASTRGPVVSTKSRSNRTANTDNGKNRGMTIDDAIEIMSTSSESSEISDVPSLPSIGSLGGVPKRIRPTLPPANSSRTKSSVMEMLELPVTSNKGLPPVRSAQSGCELPHSGTSSAAAVSGSLPLRNPAVKPPAKPSRPSTPAKSTGRRHQVLPEGDNLPSLAKPAAVAPGSALARNPRLKKILPAMKTHLQGAAVDPNTRRDPLAASPTSTCHSSRNVRRPTADVKSTRSHGMDLKISASSDRNSALSAPVTQSSFPPVRQNPDVLLLKASIARAAAQNIQSRHSTSTDGVSFTGNAQEGHVGASAAAEADKVPTGSSTPTQPIEGRRNPASPDEMAATTSTLSISQTIATTEGPIFNVFGDRCGPQSMNKERSTPVSMRSIVSSSEIGEKLPSLLDSEDWYTAMSRTPSSTKTEDTMSNPKSALEQHEEVKIPSEPDLMALFDDFDWTTPTAQPVTAPAEEAVPPTPLLPSEQPRSDATDVSMVSAQLHLPLISDEASPKGTGVSRAQSMPPITRLEKTAEPKRLRAASESGADNVDPKGLSILPSRTKEHSCLGATGEDGKCRLEVSPDKAKEAVKAKEAALRMIARLEKEVELPTEADGEFKFASLSDLDEDEEDAPLEDITSIIAQNRKRNSVAIAVSNVDRVLRSQDPSVAPGSGPVAFYPEVSRVHRKDPAASAFNRLMKDTIEDKSYALLKEVQGYDKGKDGQTSAPYPTPSLTDSPPPPTATSPGSSGKFSMRPAVKEAYGEWKGFWANGDDFLQVHGPPTVVKEEEPEPKARTPLISLVDQAIFEGDQAAALAVLTGPSEPVMAHHKETTLKDLMLNVLRWARATDQVERSTAALLWASLVSNLAINSSMHAEKDLLLPLVQLLVDYDTKISLRIAVQDAIAQVLSRMSTADFQTVLQGLADFAASFGASMQLAITRSLGRGQLHCKRLAQWFAAVSLTGLPRSPLLQSCTSVTSVPPPDLLRDHLRDAVIPVLKEEVHSNTGQFPASMRSLQLLAVAMQDSEAILQLVGKAGQEGDGLSARVMRDWLAETIAITKQAADMIPMERGVVGEATLLRRLINGIGHRLDFQGRAIVERLTRSKSGGEMIGQQRKLPVRRQIAAD